MGCGASTQPVSPTPVVPPLTLPAAKESGNGAMTNGLVALMKNVENENEWYFCSKIVQILPGTVYSVSCHLNI